MRKREYFKEKYNTDDQPPFIKWLTPEYIKPVRKTEEPDDIEEEVVEK